MQTPYGDAAELIKQFLKYQEECEHARRISEIQATIMNQQEEDEKNDYPLPEDLKCEFRDVRIDELFEYAGNGKQENNNLPDGLYPLISTSSHNNGIIKYVNKYDFDGTYITVAFNGSVGTCFVQRGKFTLGHGQVIALKLKPEYQFLEECLSSLAFAMTMEFRMKYSYNNKLNKERLMNETISSIPYCQDPKDKTKMIIDVSGLRYIYIYITNYYGHIFESPINVIMKEVRINELFEFCKNTKVVDRNASKPGPYQYVSIMGTNNGICGTIDHYQFDGIYVTIAIDGNSAGTCFVQKGKFTTTQNVKVIKLKQSYQYLTSCLGFLTFIMTQKFTNIYSWTNKANDSRLMNETIELPVVVRGLSEEQINNLINGLTTIDEITDSGKNDKYTYEINENLLNNYIYTCLM